VEDPESKKFNHPYGNLPNVWGGTFDPPPLADPDDPHRVIRSHLQKIELGKSSSSCKVSFITRLHRRTALEEFWCASFEEAEVYLNIAAHPMVVGFKEQLTRMPYTDKNGCSTHTLWDLHVLLKNGREVLVSVKYDEKARRTSYLEEAALIAKQCPVEVADGAVVASRFSFHPVYRECARAIHKARRGWDPEADAIVLKVANDLGNEFTFGRLVEASQLSGRGYRAAVRLIGDGDISKHILGTFSPDTQLWRAAA
jgi:hypothetical protein